LQPDQICFFGDSALQDVLTYSILHSNHNVLSPFLNYDSIVVHYQIPSFLHYDIFHFTVQSSLVFTPATVISLQLFLPSPKRFIISWSDPSDLIPPLLFYIKPPLAINKQFSNDLFLIGKVFTGILAQRLHILFTPLRSPPSFRCPSIRHANREL